MEQDDMSDPASPSRATSLRSPEPACGLGHPVTPAIATGTILLYTKGAKIGDATRKRLVAAGYIPIEVGSLADIQILGPAIPQARLDIISAAAIEAIPTSEFTTKEFGRLVAKKLIAKASSS